MATDNKYKMSKERYDALVAELHYLETDKANEVAEQIKEARSFGDLSENSEYDEAKTEQGKLYSKIAEMKNLIDNAEIVEKTDDSAPTGSVTLGSIVTVRDLDEGDEASYTIVGSQEANPMEYRISDDSPVGRALYGHVAGDKVAVNAPDGELHFEILNVEKA